MSETETFTLNANQLTNFMKLKGWWSVEILNTKFGGLDYLLNQINSNKINGINDDEVNIKKRKNIYGSNEYPSKSPNSLYYCIKKCLKDVSFALCIIISSIAFTLSLSGLGIGILISVLTLSSLNGYREWTKEKENEAFKEKNDRLDMRAVIRNGKIKLINVKELVVGDICFIRKGDIIGADGILFQANGLKIDESYLYGENCSIADKNNTEFVTVLSGTNVIEGDGKYVVLAVGLNTQIGQLIKYLN